MQDKFFKPTHEQLKQWLIDHGPIKGGVNVITWTWPSAAAPVAPVNTNTVRGTIAFDGATASLVITHNLGFSVAELAAGLPKVTLTPATITGYSETPAVLPSSNTTNTITVVSAGAHVCTWSIEIARVQSSVA
jgi:hypothetical protein